MDTSLDLELGGLEPPEPMIRILNLLETLPPGGSFRARTDRQDVYKRQVERRPRLHDLEPQPEAEQGGNQQEYPRNAESPAERRTERRPLDCG